MAKKNVNVDPEPETMELVVEKAERMMTFRADEKFTKDAQALAEQLGLSSLRVRAIVNAEVQQFIAGLDVKALVRRAMFGD